RRAHRTGVRGASVRQGARTDAALVIAECERAVAGGEYPVLLEQVPEEAALGDRVGGQLAIGHWNRSAVRVLAKHRDGYVGSVAIRVRAQAGGDQLLFGLRNRLSPRPVR